MPETQGEAERPGVRWRKIPAPGHALDKGQPCYTYEPFVEDGVPPLEGAVKYLRTAAEIEHGVMVEYLFAALSLRDPDAAALVTGIAVEEMAHLLTVQNLLLAAGAEPYLGRQDQWPDTQYDPFAFRLQRAEPAVIACFVVAESPEPHALNWLDRWELRRISREADAHLRRLKDYEAGHAIVHRVGKIYEKLLEMCAKGGALGDLKPKSEALARQASPGEAWAHAGLRRTPLVSQIHNSADARHAIDAISRQGEGYLCASNSHFDRFRALRRGIKRMRWLPWSRARDRSVQPLQRLAWISRKLGAFDGALYDWKDEQPAGEPPWLSNAVDLFNIRYRLLLLMIHAALDLPAGAPGREDRIRVLMQEMVLVLQPLGTLVRETASRARMESLYALPREFPPAKKEQREKALADLRDATKPLLKSIAGDPGKAPLSAIAEAAALQDDRVERATPRQEARS